MKQWGWVVVVLFVVLVLVALETARPREDFMIKSRDKAIEEIKRNAIHFKMRGNCWMFSWYGGTPHYVMERIPCESEDTERSLDDALYLVHRADAGERATQEALRGLPSYAAGVHGTNKTTSEVGGREI